MESQIRIVLVEDNSCMLWALRHLIDEERPSMAVEACVSRRAELAEAISRITPDVILLDGELEGESSLDLIALIRESCAAKMLVFTAVRNATLNQNSILAGAHGLVFKSEPVDVVLRAIRAVHAGELWLRRDMTAKIVGMMTAARRQTTVDTATSMFTSSERRVMSAAVKYRGAPNKIIADVLHMSPNTFRNHLSAIYMKLGIHRRLDLVLYGIKHGVEEHADGAQGEDVISATAPQQESMCAVMPVNGGHARSDVHPNGFEGSAPVRLIKASLRAAGATNATRR